MTRKAIIHVSASRLKLHNWVLRITRTVLLGCDHRYSPHLYRSLQRFQVVELVTRIDNKLKRIVDFGEIETGLERFMGKSRNWGLETSPHCFDGHLAS